MEEPARLGVRADALRARISEIRRRNGLAVQGNKIYTWPSIGFTSVAAGRRIVEDLTAFLLGRDAPAPDAESTADKTVLRAIKERRGQDAFRQRLLSIYGGRCVISGCDVVEALEAAHIVPHASNGSYGSTNGLLMRADIHTLFDLHLISLCPDTLAVKVNPRLRPAYTEFESKLLPLPATMDDHPDRSGLAQHYAVFESLL